MTGVPKDSLNLTCTSGAGSLMLEFGLLSRLLGDPVYETVARRAVDHLWNHRNNVTGLFGRYVWEGGGCTCYTFVLEHPFFTKYLLLLGERSSPRG